MDDYSITFFVLDLILTNHNYKSGSPPPSLEPRCLALDYTTRYPDCFFSLEKTRVVDNGNKTATLVNINGPKQQVLAARGEVLRGLERTYHCVIEVGYIPKEENVQPYRGIARRCDIDLSSLYSTMSRSDVMAQRSLSNDSTSINTTAVRDRYNSQNSEETAVNQSPDRISLIRKVNHDGWVEESACQLALTGQMDSVADASRAILVHQDKAVSHYPQHLG
jgi:hypothetical protein